MGRLILLTSLMLALSDGARAQVAAQSPPVRKYKGFCFSSDHGEYRKLPEFIPFKTMQDCLKSGGMPVPQKEKNQIGR